MCSGKIDNRRCHSKTIILNILTAKEDDCNAGLQAMFECGYRRRLKHLMHTRSAETVLVADNEQSARHRNRTRHSVYAARNIDWNQPHVSSVWCLFTWRNGRRGFTSDLRSCLPRCVRGKRTSFALVMSFTGNSLNWKLAGVFHFNNFRPLITECWYFMRNPLT